MSCESVDGECDVASLSLFVNSWLCLCLLLVYWRSWWCRGWDFTQDRAEL